MAEPIPTEVREAIARELVAAEFRAGEFHHALSRKYGVGAKTVGLIAARLKREAACPTS